MRIIIWGTGNYCKEKIDSIDKKEIVAIVDRTKKEFYGYETILPEELLRINFDKIFIFSNSFFEILNDLLELGIDYRKIVPGFAIKPLLFHELELCGDMVTSIETSNDGGILINYIDGEQVKISSYEDILKLKKKICDENNAKLISDMSCLPVGKHYGGDRGGSIVRRYIEKFITDNKQYITGNVLEIGDREYTNRFGRQQLDSYVLHFDSAYQSTQFDFYGDLQTGEGLKENYYDCIILTQVLNFVQDIRNVPQILIRSLKPNGVLLLTVSGITPICRYDMDRYGQYWSFTDKSIMNMFKDIGTKVEIQSYGNFKTACAFLAGMSSCEMEQKDMLYHDKDFPVIIAAKIEK